MPHPLLQTTHHRPWPLPEQSWQFYQEWNDAIFLHYPVELAELKQWVPPELEIDLFEGQAWVSVVAFTMEKRGAGPGMDGADDACNTSRAEGIALKAC